MFNSAWFAGTAVKHQIRRKSKTQCLVLEALENRHLLYSAFGSVWPTTDLTYGIVPDGSQWYGNNSEFYGLINKNIPPASWQRTIALAFQSWANHIPLNFIPVSDHGERASANSANSVDPMDADIRIGSSSTIDSTARAFSPGPGHGGDIMVRSSFVEQVQADSNALWRVLVHEIGHSLGLGHSTIPGSVMAYGYNPTVLSSDDILGIQSRYGARQPDAYDSISSNETMQSATSTSWSSLDAFETAADLSSYADIDHYRVTLPADQNALVATVDAKQTSLLAPSVAVYDNQGELLGRAWADYGQTASIRITGLTPGAQYVIVADGATNDGFQMGAYRFSIKAENVGASTSGPVATVLVGTSAPMQTAPTVRPVAAPGKPKTASTPAPSETATQTPLAAVTPPNKPASTTVTRKATPDSAIGTKTALANANLQPGTSTAKQNSSGRAKAPSNINLAGRTPSSTARVRRLASSLPLASRASAAILPAASTNSSNAATLNRGRAATVPSQGLTLTVSESGHTQGMARLNVDPSNINGPNLGGCCCPACAAAAGAGRTEVQHPSGDRPNITVANADATSHPFATTSVVTDSEPVGALAEAAPTEQSSKHVAQNATTQVELLRLRMKNLSENPVRPLKNESNYNSLSYPTSGVRIGSKDGQTADNDARRSPSGTAAKSLFVGFPNENPAASGRIAGRHLGALNRAALVAWRQATSAVDRVFEDFAEG